MTIPAIAASAYAAARSLAEHASAGASARSAPGGAAGPDTFASLVGHAMSAVGEAGRRSDAAGAAVAASGQTDVVDIVTAVADSEAAIGMLVGVRDRIIASYQQIMNMPI